MEMLEEGIVIENRLKDLAGREVADFGTSRAGRESFARWLQME